MITREQLERLGFKDVPNFTIMNAMTLELGRRRRLTVGDIGNPNEVMFICEMDPDDTRKTTDLVCVHNYDYDGYLTKTKVLMLIRALTVKNPG